MAPRGMTPQRAQRANKVMEMRRDAIPFRDIANKVGVSLSTAHEDYQLAIRETYRGSTTELISTQHQRLENLYATYITLAETGDHDAANICLKVIEQTNKLFGLNGAVKLDAQGGAAEKFAQFLNTLRGDTNQQED